MPDDDFIFGFDTTSFEKGIEKVTKGITGLQSTTQSVAKGVSKGLTAVAVKFGSVFAGVKAVQGALKNMPEVGQAFGIAKDVFLKNLLFPLRKEIFPLLQKMLDWVRDSRGSFVRWGQSIANVFRSVVAGIKNLIGFMKKVTMQIGGFAEKIFGDRIRNINELFDLVTFKLATVVQFVSLLVEDLSGLFVGMFRGMEGIGGPLKGIIDNLGKFLRIFTDTNDQGNSLRGVMESLGEQFGKIVTFITQMTDSFLDGFIPAIEDVFTPLQRIVDSWSDIWELIFGSTESMEKWSGIFESLGSFLGGAFMFTLETIASIVEGIEEAVKSIQELGFGGAIKKGLGNLIDESKSGPSGYQRMMGIDDGIVKSDGTVIRTHPDDNIIATKNPVLQAVPQTNNNQQKTFNMNITPTIVLQGAGNESQGRAVATGLIEEMRLQFNSEFERGGF